MKAILIVILLSISTIVNAAAQRYPYQRCFEIAATLHDLPIDLVLAVAATESNWDPDARSHANAHGIMQIQWPGTAKDLGVERVSELYNPCLNIELGSRYLKELLGRFDGDETKALAAYNYGPGRIERSSSIPEGALKYVATVRKHRKRVRGGNLPKRLQANKNATLMVFDSATRAKRLASKLSNALDGATARYAKVSSGHAVNLVVGQAGLTMSDRVMLQGLGLAQ